MRTVLIGPEIEENLSLRYLAAALEAAGHDCRVLAFDHARDIGRLCGQVRRERPGLIGLSLVAQRRAGDVFDLAAAIRADGFRGHITAGGHFAGLRAPEVLCACPPIDSIVHHDGEARIVRLADALAAGEPVPPTDLDGFSWREAADPLGAAWASVSPDRARSLEPSAAPALSVAHRPAASTAVLDTIAEPVRRTPSRVAGIPVAPLVSSRGCTGSCAFCSIHAWHLQAPGPRVRFRSPERVAEEMARLHERWGVRVFVFHDDDFVHPDPAEAMRRSRAMLGGARRRIGRDFAFVIKCRPDRVRRDLFAYFREMGLSRTYVGIETHALSSLRGLNRRAGPQTNENAMRILRETGVYACFNLLLFDPDTTLESLHENLDFLERWEEVPCDIGRTELYARTPLEERMLREGRAFGTWRGYDYRIADARAEAAFRLFAEVFRERQFGRRPVVRRAQELGHAAGLLRRLRPAGASAEFEARVHRIIREINRDTVRFMREVAEVASHEGTTASGESQRRLEAARDLRTEVDRRVADQDRRLAMLEVELAIRGRLGEMARRHGPARNGPARTPEARPARVIRWAGQAASAVSCAAVALLGASCGGEGADICDPPPPPFDFHTDIEPQLDSRCAVEGCHAAEAASAGLVLEAGASYDALVGVASTQLPSMDRVEPDHPDSSYVAHKLEGTQGSVGGSGERMPKGGPYDPDLAASVRHWVAMGAPLE